MKFTKKTIYISLFAILYLIVAFSSFFHACAFFGLANNTWMSIILAFAFEVGQAAVLFSLLTSQKDRSRIMPWVLMTMFTLVQVIGNVYSSYKYIIQNSVENLRYFKEPIFIWTELPDAQANVIIVYLVGALLPIAALLLTSMITNYLTDQSEENNKLISFDKEDNKENENSLINQNAMLQMENKSLEELNNAKEQEIEQIKKQLEEKENEDKQGEEKPNNDNDQQQLGGTEDQGDSEGELSKSTTEADEPKSDGEHILGESTESIKEENIDKEELKRESHFINL